MSEINFVTLETRLRTRIRDHLVRLVVGEHTVGIAVDSAAIRAAHVRHGREGTLVVQVAEVPLPPQTLIDGGVMNPAVFGDVLRELHARLRSGGMPEHARGVLLITGHSLILKQITMPLMTDAELSEQFGWEAEQHIPFDINDVIVAHGTLRHRSDQGQMDMLLAAAKRDEVRELLRLASAAGFQIEAMEPTALALGRALHASSPATGAPETRVVVEVTDDLTTIAVFVGDTLTFTRDIVHAFSAVVEAVQKNLGVSYEEARSMIASLVAPDGELVPNALRTIVVDEVESICGEIQRSLDFFLATSNGPAFTSVSLCGPGAALPGFRESLERRARCPATLLDTGAGLGPASVRTDVRTRYASAIGAALRTDFAVAIQAQPDAHVRESRTNVVRLRRDEVRAREARDAKLRRPKKYRPSKEELARFLEVLDFMLAAGVPMLDTLRTIASDPAIGGRRFRRAFQFVVIDVSGGKTLAEALEWGFTIPPLIACLIDALEQSGKLDSGQLRRTAQFIRTGSFGHGGEALPDYIQNALRRSA